MGLQYLDEVRLENLAARLRETYQHLSSDLTAIAALTGQTGFLKKNGAGSWSIDSTSYVSAALLGAANGVAQLGSDQKVLASQLPSFVDDVLEYSTRSAFPATGESGKIYVAKDTNLTYRWGGTDYVEISASLALGETASTAYAGNKGKANADNITTLQGYFAANGIAKNAARLSNTVAIGSTVMPVYFGADGKPTPIGYTISRDVAAGEDVTPYTAGSSINISSHVVKVFMDEYDSPASSGAAIDFIDTVQQAENGTISATKKAVREASASQSGIVSTGAQTFAGNKTINGTLTATGDIQSTGGGVSAHGIADLSVGGGSGVSDYDQLVNKPYINGHILAAGNNSLSNLGIQAEINSSNKLSYSLLSGAPTTLASFTDDATHRLVTDVEKSTWNGKQNAITSSSKLSASLIETSTTLQFVTADQKTEWNNITTIKGYFTNGKANNAINADSATTATTATTATKVGHTLTVGSKTFDGSADVSIVKGDIGLGNVENTALSTWHGTNQITTLGTISTGVWQGTKIADAYINSASEWNKQADWNQTTTTAIDYIKNKPSIVNTFGGKSGAVTVRGGLTANGSVNLTMNGQQLEASIVGLKALAYKDSLAYSEVTDKPTINQTTGTSTTDLMSQKAITDIFAQKDGNYPELVAGNLFGVVNEENAEFFYRPSAGAVNIADGIATFKAMYGKTILWNQLVNNTLRSQTKNGITWTNNGDGTITSTGTATGDSPVDCMPNTPNVPIEHKWLVTGMPSGGSTSTYYLLLIFYKPDEEPIYKVCVNPQIITTPSTGGYQYRFQTRVWAGDAPSEKWIPQAYDLTAMFGAGNEPSSVDEFRALFPLDYYAYNAGQLLSFTGTGIKTIGVNLWNEQWELGGINENTGALFGSTDRWRTKNYIQVINSPIYLLVPSSYGAFTLIEYDGAKNAIAHSYNANRSVTLNGNTRFVKFVVGNTASPSTQYNHDIQIALYHSGGTIPTTYHPYEEHTLALPVAEKFTPAAYQQKPYALNELCLHDNMMYKCTTAIATAEAWNSAHWTLVRAAGIGEMLSSDSAHDELTKDGMVINIGSIVLNGTEDGISLQSINDYGIANFAFYTAQFLPLIATTGYSAIMDKLARQYGAIASTTSRGYYINSLTNNVFYIRIESSIASTVSAFKTWLSSNPIVLYYKLAEPIVIPFAEPINLNYQVSDWGTEQLLPVNDDEPTTTPLNASITYGLNAKDELRLLPFTYVSAKSRQQFTDAEKAIGRQNIAALGQAELTAGLATKANTSGNYPELNAGNLYSKIQQQNTEFLYRPTADHIDIETGLGNFKAMYGKTILWNQLLDVDGAPASSDSKGITLTRSHGHLIFDGVFTEDEGYVTIDIANRSIRVIEGHKYYLGNTAVKSSSNFRDRIVLRSNDWSAQFTVYDNIWTSTFSGNSRVSSVIPCHNGQSYHFETDIQVFDLTQMFGAGNEPSSVDEFKALFPLDYYAYNAGQLLSFAGTGLKTIGFNAYKHSAAAAEVIGGMQYQITGAYTALTLDGEAVTPDASGIFTPAKTGTLAVTGGDSTTTCIHLVHSGTRNGEYEPYEEHLLPLPITTVTGKKNGAGNSVVVFPDGMRSTGTVKDELVVENGKFVKAIKRIKKVDMGSLIWVVFAAGTEHSRFVATLPAAKKVGPTEIANILCVPYTSTTHNAVFQHSTDKAIACGTNDSGVGVYDSAYTDAAAFKTAMSGVELYYELAEPEEYILDTPISTEYYVNDWGTEEVISAHPETPDTTPMNASIEYGMNAKDQLRNLPFSYLSFKGLQHLTDSEKLTARTNIDAVSTTQLTAGLALKQDAITLGSKLSSDLVDDTAGTNKFVTTTEKNTWNAKQNAITPFTTPTASGNALAFVDDISFNGTSFSLTRKNIPAANGTTQAGIVSTGNQSFGGNKEFLGDVKFDGKITVDGDIYLQPEKGLVSEETVSGTVYVRSLFRYDGASAGLRIGYRGNDTLGYGYTKLKLYGTEIDAYANLIGHGYISGTNGVSAGGIADLSTGGGGGGTSDYDQLINKPKINNHELAAGNNTLDTLGIQAKIDAQHTIAWAFVQHPDTLDNLVLTPTIVSGEVVGFELEIGDDSVSVGHIADSVIDNLVL